MVGIGVSDAPRGGFDSLPYRGRPGPPHTEGIQFLSHSEGSVAELETQLILGVELGFCALADTQEATSLATELSKMLDSLRRKLEVGP